MKFYRLVSVLMIVALLALSPGAALVSAQEPDGTPTSEVAPAEEPTQEATVTPTEGAALVATEVVTPTEEATVEPTEEATVEPTEEATVEPTEEATVEPTEEATVEPTEEVTPTEEATVEPTVAPAEGGIEAQAYSGSWTSTIAVQNMGSNPAQVAIAWYKNGASSTCYETTDATDLAPGASRYYPAPSSGTCGTSWMGSAVVSGSEPLGAVAENVGSLGQLLSEYSGSSEPSTEDIIIPQTNNTVWDPLIGISNAGNDTANVVITLLNRDGTTFTTANRTIPAQSAIQVRVKTDITSSSWQGSIKISQTGTAQPLYAVNKAERSISGRPYPVSVAYEGWKISDARDTFLVPTVLKQMKSGSTTIPNGQNATIGVVNPSASTAISATIKFLDRDGNEVVAARQVLDLPASATQYVTTRDTTGLPSGFNGSARIEATGPVIALGQPWVAATTATGYTAWAFFTPVDPDAGVTATYIPSVHKQSSGGSRSGNGWCTSIIAVNLDQAVTSTVRIDIYSDATGLSVFNQQVEIAPSGKTNWYTLQSAYDASLGTNFKGGAKITVLSGGLITALGQQTGKTYGTSSSSSDSYGFFNASHP
jgi:hypothetical protein